MSVLDRLTDETPQTWPQRVTLKYPVDLAGEQITVLEFRRGKMGHLNGMEASKTPSIDELLLIASRMCGQPLAVLEQLGAEDGAEACAIALRFFVNFLGAGAKP